MTYLNEFSHRTRAEALRRFEVEEFDLLVIGGGITGAAVARDAVSRGLKVALVEKDDFASGTSSRSSKLIHGGLRYLENLEFGLIFEALSERSFLLKSAPHLVRPLPFILPIYKGDRRGRAILTLGLWLYDALALFRTPGFHRYLLRRSLLNRIPFLKETGLKGGFRYYDASMWDDALTVETLRAAATSGAAIANYVEAVRPVWRDTVGQKWIFGFEVIDRLANRPESIHIRAKRTVVCVGPWTDDLGLKIDPAWRKWLKPSKGIHLVFDLKKIPVPAAMVMDHPEDGRVSFVIPRPDFGAGVVIVGTTDGPAPEHPEDAKIDATDVRYLLELLHKYFPKLAVTESDILAGYVGVRPLFDPPEEKNSATGVASLQRVSREHYIGEGPGGTVIVAGGKYTTHRVMGEEIVDATLRLWKKDANSGAVPEIPPIHRSRTYEPVNPAVTRKARAEVRRKIGAEPGPMIEKLIDRYGAEAEVILGLAKELPSGGVDDPDGFPFLEAQLRHAIRTGMVMRLEDFYLRRVPLYLSRRDHGLPWAQRLSEVWAEELELSPSVAGEEAERIHHLVKKIYPPE